MADAKIPAEEIQKLLGRIAELRKAIASAGEPGRAALGAIESGLRGIHQELGADAEGKFEVGAWDRLSEQMQASLRQRLQTAAQLLDRITAGDDGPPDSDSIMFKAHASNSWIITLTLFGILFSVGVLVAVWAYWGTATFVMPEVRTDDGKAVKTAAQGPAEAAVLGMVILMGALGGCLHWTSSLAMFVGNGQLLRRWIPYYLIMPFEGAALAPVIYLLLRTGVLGTGSQGTSTGTAQLNLVSLYAFAGLTGLFAKQAIEMLADVFAIIFKKIQAKDAVEEKKPKTSDGQSSGGGKAP
jgi:hypothetical protein